MSSSILAGDIGGTKSRLGLFEPAAPRPRPLVVQEFTTGEYRDLEMMITDFLRDERLKGARPDRACFGVAGPVVEQAAELTNVPWRVEAEAIARAFDLRRVALLNDLQAMATAVPLLAAEELHVLQKGRAVRGGNIALIAAGTGLGEALLHPVDGRLVPSPSEGGHADFAARNEREFALARYLIDKNGRADIEHVLSGRGFVNLHLITHGAPCDAAIDLDDPDAPAAISRAALDRRCAGCVGTLEMFVDAYGAEAGNLALRMVATGGVFVGGGIAPKILPALTTGAFMRAFTEKPPMDDLLRSMPVNVILNGRAGLLGAAVHAAGL